MIQHLKDARASVDKAWENLRDFQRRSGFRLERGNREEILDVAFALHKTVFELRVRVKNLPCEEMRGV